MCGLFQRGKLIIKRYHRLVRFIVCIVKKERKAILILFDWIGFLKGNHVQRFKRVLWLLLEIKGVFLTPLTKLFFGVFTLLIV